MGVVLTGSTCKSCRKTFTARPLAGSNDLIFEEYCHRCYERTEDFMAFLEASSLHDPLRKVKEKLDAQDKLDREATYAELALNELEQLACKARTHAHNRITVSDSEFHRYLSFLLVTYRGRNSLDWCRTYFVYKDVVVMSDRSEELLGLV